MRGTSAESFDRLAGQLGEAVDAGADADRLGDDLFAAVAVFREHPALRRAATDPTSDFDARSAMLRAVFEKHLDAPATELLAAAGKLRWSSSLDLVDVFERLGVIAVARAADGRGEGDRLESELFAFGQTIAQNPDLRVALTDNTRSVEDKRGLLRSLLEGRASDGTLRLATQALLGGHQTVRQAFEDYARIATESRGRIVAVVRAARALDEDVQARLRKVLSGQYGREVHLNVVVDPATLGGLQVEVGDEVIDGTVASRLHDARRRVAG
jgi:F-type H+-transporting ATPase subunit delta